MHPDGRARPTSREGAALLEVVVGLTILAVAGTAFVALLAQSAESVRAFRHREAETVQAAAALERITLWSHTELAAHAGTIALPGLTVRISEIAPSLYAIAMTDSVDRVALLRTVLYAPDTSRTTFR
jgi:Tfp pilus assembly protein PilV